MLYDKDFLFKLDQQKNKTIYARLTALTFSELPIESIEGRVTAGSVNVDGSSAVRRTCNLTIVADNFNYQDYYWGLKTKFKLEIGVGNYIDPVMPDIIWFNQGIYLITSFNTAQSATNFSISISGKDKMCLLNGEIGGVFESTIDFGTIEEENSSGVWEIRKIPIPEIIKNMIHTYGQEPYHNIIINDLDTCGLELLEYRYDTPLYLVRGAEDAFYSNAFLEDDVKRYYLSEDLSGDPISLKDLDLQHLETLVDPFTGTVNPLPVYTSAGEEIIFAKISYGQTAGYRTTDLTYAGDLIANVGSTITGILDSIKNMLVEFEYFYNLEGQFVFQKKESFINTLWSPVSYDENREGEVVESLQYATGITYSFTGNSLISAISNNPSLVNMRNDYSIWGSRTGSSGATIPVHLRYAIHKKPTYYMPITVSDNEVEDYNLKYGTNLTGQNPTAAITTDQYDWREIIFAMANDYYKYNFLDDFELRIIKANPQHYPTGQTGYEKYYIDMYSFWRDLYDPTLEAQIETLPDLIDALAEEIESLEESIAETSNTIISLNESITSEEATQDQVDEYTAQLSEKIDILLNLKTQHTAKQTLHDSYVEQLESAQDKVENYYTTDIDSNKKYWNKFVFESPELLNFWFDFLNTSGELSQFSVETVGFRSKAVNDGDVKAIYFRETPSVIFVEDITTENQISGYKYIQIPDMEYMFSISAQGKSAKNRLDELIYQHGYCIESANITSVPIYHLQPNTRIYLYDEQTHLNGEYIINKITLPLTYNGTMTITATKAAENWI